MGPLLRPLWLSHNIIDIVCGFNVTTRQNFAGVLVDVDCIPCNGKLLGVVGCNPKVSCLCILAILFVTIVVCAVFECACVSVNIFKACTLPIVSRNNPVAALFGVSIDNHSMYPLKVLLCFAIRLSDCNYSVTQVEYNVKHFSKIFLFLFLVVEYQKNYVFLLYIFDIYIYKKIILIFTYHKLFI